MSDAYVIECGIPCPATRRGGNRVGPQTEWTRTLSQLQPGQSVLTERFNDIKGAEQFIRGSRPRQYAVRKIAGQGWRVWRIE